jgi:hypothetical protein
LSTESDGPPPSFSRSLRSAIIKTNRLIANKNAIDPSSNQTFSAQTSDFEKNQNTDEHHRRTIDPAQKKQIEMKKINLI